jgi:flagellar hook assembly protein FlgD
MASEFTAGPNPVAKSSEVVNFYRAGKRVDNVTLTIFDATGNVVNKIRINDDRPDDDQSRRIIGTWDLTDARGRLVSKGAYLVRGVITTSDGKRERVSLTVGVR